MVSIPSVLSLAYLRWLHTQGLMQKGPHNSVSLTGWLVREGALFSRRAPGHTCISALSELNGATSKRADNDSKGAGGIMRIAPVAMMYANEPDQEAVVFRVAKEAAWITHGHPSGYLAAGGFAVILHGLFCGRSLQQSIFAAQHILIAQSDAAEVLQHIDRALVLADRTDRDPEQDIAELGEGWVAEEALAIALYCGLSSKDFSSGICMAVNLEGDSDTTGSLVGQLLGATCGYANIPVRWTEELELRAVILKLADDISAHEKWNLDYMDQARYDDAIVQRYMD